MECGLRIPIATSESKIPVVHVRARPVPFVGPRVSERPRTAGGEGRADLPIEHPRLDILAVAPAVETDFAHHERALAGERLQTRQLCLEPILGFGGTVIGGEIQELEPQVFGGRIVDICDQAVGSLVLRSAIQPLQVALDPRRAEPARQRSGNLVAHGVAQHGWMAGGGADAGAYDLLDVGSLLLFCEEPDVTLHREADHDAQAMTLCCVQEPDGWHGIEADGVEAIRGHRGEIPLDYVGLGYLGSVRPRSERSVGHAADVELLVADEEKLAVDAWPSCGLNNGRGSRMTIARAMPSCCTNGARSYSDRTNG